MSGRRALNARRQSIHNCNVRRVDSLLTELAHRDSRHRPHTVGPHCLLEASAVQCPLVMFLRRSGGELCVDLRRTAVQSARKLEMDLLCVNEC